MNSALASTWPLALAISASTPAFGQDALQGMRIYQETASATGINTLTGSCTSCHGAIADRRASIAGDRFAEIDQQVALDRLRSAIGLVGAMRQFQDLSPENLIDLAAYIADTPRRSVTRLDFTSTTVNAASATQSIELAHAVATSQPLHVLGVEVSGAQAARFTRTADSCDQQTLAPATSCRITMSFAAPDADLSTARLTLTLRQGGAAAASFTRSVDLEGIASLPPASPPSPPASAASASDNGAGGAVGGLWLALLSLAIGLLARATGSCLQRSTKPGCR